MADNVTANPGTGGATFATDDVGGVQYPRSKLVWGVDGVATDASASDPLPVALPAAQVATLTPYATVGVSNFPASFSVSNFPATQPVSGTFFQATQPVSLASMPSTPVTGTFWQATQPVSGTFYQATQPVSAVSLPLPAGAATDTLQTSGNASLTSMDGKTPALGQALAAASTPVVLTAAQLVTLTPPAAITGYATDTLQTAGNASLTSIAAEDFSTSAKQDTANASLANLEAVDFSTSAEQQMGRDRMDEAIDLLFKMYGELRILNANVAAGLNTRDDIDTMRQDPYFNPTLQ